MDKAELYTGRVPSTGQVGSGRNVGPHNFPYWVVGSSSLSKMSDWKLVLDEHILYTPFDH